MHIEDHMEDMPRYKDHSPTGFDRHICVDEIEDWVVSLNRNRDSDLCDESNWSVATKEFEKIDPNGNDHQIHNFGHWACGWYELILVRPDSPCHKLATEFMCSLADSCLLDEDDHSEREHDAVCQYWEQMSIKERIEECNQSNQSIFSARRDNPADRVYDRMRDRI